MAMRRPRTAQLALGLLCLSAFSIGLTATAFPRTFYDDFPFLSHWVDLLPPYNEHLVTDVGGLYLGFSVLFGWAVLKPQRALVQPVCVAWILTSTLHLVFHADHLDGFGAADGVAELASLALLPALALVALWASRPEVASPEGDRV
jgi:hypothetical protein